MNNLWTFGDSFIHVEPCSNDEQWCNYVAKLLGYKHNAFGQGGTALSYTYDKFCNEYTKFKHDDVVIICLTSLERKWFFEHKPYTTVHNFEVWNNKNELEAYKMYLKYLDKNPKLEIIYLKMFLALVNNIAKDIKTMVFANFDDVELVVNDIKDEFPNICFMNVKLNTISANEFENNKLFEKFYQIMRYDARINHMLKSNHTILANKIINFIQHNIPVDYNGFVENTITEDFDTDPNELFHNHWILK